VKGGKETMGLLEKAVEIARKAMKEGKFIGG
jgi:hypothetical protein